MFSILHKKSRMCLPVFDFSPQRIYTVTAAVQSAFGHGKIEPAHRLNVQVSHREPYALHPGNAPAINRYWLRDAAKAQNLRSLETLLLDY